MQDPPVSHLREVLSNISGSVSLACWVIILLPQLLEQWRLKSSDGVAIGFILAWLFGDLANFVGALWGHLRPNVVLLALWFCFSDALLVLSYYYYKRMANQHPVSPQLGCMANSRDAEAGIGTNGNHSGDCTPLLQETAEINSEHTSYNSSEALNPDQNWLLGKGLPAVFVVVVATLSYFISDSAGPDESPVKTSLGPEVLGYVSAVLYLTARIPQIVQNHRRRSVQGLSMGFFTLSIIGNLTYAGQMIIYRTDAAWVTEYIPWLLGSVGTVAEDLIILGQFHAYKNSK